jgi:hypothetical protein
VNAINQMVEDPNDCDDYSELSSRSEFPNIVNIPTFTRSTTVSVPENAMYHLPSFLLQPYISDQAASDAFDPLLGDEIPVYHMDKTKFQQTNKIMNFLLQQSHVSCSQYPSVPTILTSADIGPRRKTELCLRTMRLIFERCLDCAIMNFGKNEFPNENNDLKKMNCVISKRKKLRGLTNGHDKNLQGVFSRELKGTLTLVFYQHCVDTMKDNRLLVRLNAATLLHTNPSLTYEFATVLESIANAAPVTDEKEKCAITKFRNKLDVIRLILFSAFDLMNKDNVDGTHLVIRMQKLKLRLVPITDRDQYMKSCVL